MSENAPNLNELMDTFSFEVNEWKSAIAQVAFVRQIANATGKQLDILGAWAGLLRTDLDDEVYRADIVLQWYENNCSGLPDEICYIAKQICGADSVKYVPADISGNYFLLVTGGSIDADKKAILQRLSAGGVELVDLIRSDTRIKFQCGDPCGTPLVHY